MTSRRRPEIKVRESHHIPFQFAELKAKESKSGAYTFEGYGSKWDGVDTYGDTMLAGAFSKSLQVRRPMMFFGHDMRQIPGKWIEFHEDKKGLAMVGELTPNHSLAADLEASLKHGAVDGLSVGGYTVKANWRVEDEEFVGRDIEEFDLWEVSIVGIPADGAARVDQHTVKAALDQCATLADMEDLLREAGGLSKSVATAFVARMRRLSRGEPEAGIGAKGAEEGLLDTLRGLTIPNSILGG